MSKICTHMDQNWNSTKIQTENDILNQILSKLFKIYIYIYYPKESSFSKASGVVTLVLNTVAIIVHQADDKGLGKAWKRSAHTFHKYWEIYFLKILRTKTNSTKLAVLLSPATLLSGYAPVHFLQSV